MKRLLMVSLLAASLSAIPVYAQETTPPEKGAAEEKAESPLTTAYKWFNLIVLFGALGYLLRKPAREFFEGRKAEIASGLDRAKRAQEESAARMDQIEQRLGRLSNDIAGLRAQAEQEVEAEKARIVSEAQQEVDRIVEQSRHEMERIAHGIEREIKESVADVVVERASQKLQEKMTQDDQRRVVVRFIKNL